MRVGEATAHPSVAGTAEPAVPLRGRVAVPVARDTTSTRVGATVAIAVWLSCVVLTVIGVAYRIPVREADIDGMGRWQLDDVVDLSLTIVIATVGVLIVLRGSPRRYGWLMLATGGVNSLALAAGEIGLYGWYVDDARGSAVVGGAVWLHDAGTMAGLSLLVLVLPSLFPDGRPVAPWRRAFRTNVALWAVWGACFMLADRSAEGLFLDPIEPPDNPAGVLPDHFTNPLLGVWVLLMLVSVAVSIGSLRTRWRTSVGQQRQQLKWVLFALGVAGTVMLLSVVEVAVAETAGLDDEWITAAGIPLAWTFVMVAIGLALLRCRLYDVDLVINRTVVYTVASIAVIAVYALVVAGLVSVLPDVSETGASLVGAAVVALAFAPVRSEVQRGVDRLMFGRRSDPIGVIADVGTTLATSDAPDAALQAIADTVVVALKVPGASVELTGDIADRAVTAGYLDGNTESFPLSYQGDEVGRLVVGRRSPSEALTGPDRRLLENVAHYAAGVARTVELGRVLQLSRERLVVAREEERRRLRRDLHDGLGPSLASQTFRLDAALAELDPDQVVAVEHLRALKAQNRELVADIRRLVYDLRPPALDELGLAGAVAIYISQYRDAGLAVTTHTSPDPLGELPAAVEVAGYRIVTEAVANTVRHAQATHCDITIDRSGDTLIIQVTDDGIGLPEHVTAGVGLGSMHERAAELGGTLSIAAGPNGGTRVITALPTRSTSGEPAGPSARMEVPVHG